MNNPRSVTYDSANSRLFVADASNNRILVFNAGAITNGMNATAVIGQTNYTNSGLATTTSGLQDPRQMVYDQANSRLFVGDGGNRRVLVFNTSSITNGMSAVNVLGQVDFTSAIGATTQTGLQNARGLAYHSTGNRLFVSDENSNRIMVFDVTTITNGEAAIDVIGQTNYINGGAATTQSGFSAPKEITYDSVSRRLWVVDFTNNRAISFDVGG